LGDDAPGQAILGIVQGRQGFFVIAHLDHAGNGAEGLFPIDFHVVTGIHEQGGRLVETFRIALEAFAAKGEGGALGLGLSIHARFDSSWRESTTGPITTPGSNAWPTRAFSSLARSFCTNRS